MAQTVLRVLLQAADWYCVTWHWLHAAHCVLALVVHANVW